MSSGPGECQEYESILIIGPKGSVDSRCCVIQDPAGTVTALVYEVE